MASIVLSFALFDRFLFPLAEIDRNRHPSPTGRSCLEQCLRRAGAAPRCDHCVKCQYIFPPHKITCMHRAKITSPDSEMSKVDLKIKKENTVPKTSKKIVVWIDQYPKVTLCDLSQKCHTCSHNCGYVLPNVLKRKVVRCFKQDMRAGLRLWPICLRYNKHKSQKNRLVKSSKGRPTVECEKRICRSESLNEHQKHREKGTDSQMPARHTMCHLHESWTSEDSATCSASLLLGKDANEGVHRTGMGDRDAVEDNGPGLETHRDKKIKLQTSEGSSCTFASAVKENCITEQPCGYVPPKKQMSPCQDVEDDTDEPESFTCQRVRVYTKEIEASCARTCISWPFLKSNLTPTATTACLGGSISPSIKDNRDSETVNQNQAGSCRNQIKDILLKAPTGNQEENGTSMLAERNGKRHTNMSLVSDRKDMEVALHYLQSEESLASLHLDKTSFSSPLHRDPVTDTVSASSLLVNGPETHSSASTPSPSALGLSDLETDTTLSSPMLGPFIQGGLSSLSDTSSPFPPSTLLGKVTCVELKAVENTLVNCKRSQMDSRSSSPYAPLHSSDCSQSCDSSLLLPQDDRSDEELLMNRSPPKLEPYYNTSSFKHNHVVACLKDNFLCNISKELCMDTGSDDYMLPPVLSPVTSPPRQLWRRNFSLQSSDEDTAEEQHTKHIIDGNNENSNGYLESSSVESKDSTQGEPSTSSADEEVDESNEEESQDETDCEHNVGHGNRCSEQVGGVAFNDEGPQHSAGEERLSPQITSSGRDKAVAGDSHPGSLDEVTAYEQDILLVNVMQDDPELFTNLPDQSLLKLGPTRFVEPPKIQPSSSLDGASLGLKG